MKLASLAAVFLSLAFGVHARADTLQLKSGRSVECVVLNESDDQVTVRCGYGVIGYPRIMVAKVVQTPTTAASAYAPTTRPLDTRTNGSAGRFPIWSNIVGYLSRQPWGRNLRQIPATYVDNGVQKDVPYQSFACGDDYEVNIYGDPDDPACIEIGIYRGLLNDNAAKANCVEMIATLLPNAADAGIVRAMSRAKDLVTRDELTIEVTPPDAPDAYGGWWVSIYDEAKLDRARASKAELDQVTVSAPPAIRSPTPTAATPAPRPAANAYTGDESDNDWTPDDIARRHVRTTSAGPTSGGGGRVHVRGYTRKDGTYVDPHTRRR